MPPDTEPAPAPVPASTAGDDGVCLFEWDAASDALQASPPYLALLAQAGGTTPATGRSLLALLEPADRDRLRALRSALTPAQPTYTAQWRLRDADGQPLLLEERACGFFDSGGQLVRLIGSVSSLGSANDRSASLPSSERIYRAIGESIDYGVWVCAPDGRNIYASDSFLRLVGITQEQCSDFGWGDVLHPDDAARTIAAWQECVRTAGTWDIEHRFRGVDGQWHDVLARGVPVRNAKGDVDCWAGINLDIGRLKRTEQALRDAQGFSRAILDSVSAEVAVLDRAGNIVAVNEPWRAFAVENSATPGEPAPRTAVGTNYLDVCRRARGDGAIGAEAVHDGMLAVLDGEARSFTHEYPCHAPGRERWFLLTATPLTGEQGGAVVSHTDITAPMQLSRDLHEAHERLALAQESAGAGIWDWDMLTDELVWSDQLYQLFGLDPVQAPASFETWRRIVHPEDLAAAQQRIRDAVQNKSPLANEYRIVLPTGDRRWIAALGKSTTDDTGRPVRMSGICLDITDRKQAEQQVIATTRRLQALMEALPVGVSFSEDRSCQRVSGNAALFAQFEMAPEDNVSASATERQAAGRRVRYLHEGRELSDAELPLQRAVAEGRSVPPMEFEIHLPSGRRWFAEVSGAPLRDGDGQVVAGLAVVVDVTARRQAEEALREANRRKDEFLAMLAHELRNPLTPIRNAVHIMGLLDLHQPRLRWAREVIDSQLRHLTRLVDDLMDVSRFMRGKITLSKEVLDVASVMDSAAATLLPVIEGRGQRLTVRLPPERIWLNVDRIRLTQILTNLLDNASKFSADGGHIELAAEAAGNEVAIRVRDDGRGIAPALLPHVFDLFRQGDTSLDRPTGGLGIGLTLAQQLVSLQGGRVEAASAGVGQGSTFTVRLPMAAPAPTATPEPAHESLRAAAPVRVLVVDDDVAVADSTSTWLEMTGHDPRVARSGPDALELAATFRPQVVLLDIGLAGLDGYQTAQRLRGLPGGDELLLIAITGYGDDEAVARSRAAGFDHHLVKPFDPGELVRLLSRRGTDAPHPA